MDGYLGWPTALRMIAKGHQVFGMDDYSKRAQLRQNKTISAFKVDKAQKTKPRRFSIRFVFLRPPRTDLKCRTYAISCGG